MSEDVFTRARELEQAWSHGMSRSGRDRADRDGEDVAGAAPPAHEFADFLLAHREVLGSDPYWRAYINDLDRVGSRDGGDVIDGVVVAVEADALPPARVEYFTPAETARLLRASLKREFPGVTFSVRTSGSALRVRWTDGPSKGAVNAVARQYRGAGFDGSIDLQYSVTHWLMPDDTISLRENQGSERSRGVDPHMKGARPVGGRAVQFGADYVNCERDISPAERVRMVAEVQRVGTAGLHGEWSLPLGDRWETFGSIESAAAGLSDHLVDQVDVAPAAESLPPAVRAGEASEDDPERTADPARAELRRAERALWAMGSSAGLPPVAPPDAARSRGLSP